MEVCSNFMVVRFSKILILIILSAFYVGFYTFAYDQTETHPALTKATAEFFNMQRGNTLTLSDIEALAQGSVDEDNYGRFRNHFYDPTTGKGISKVLEIRIPTQISAKEWAQNPFAQVGILHYTAQVMDVSANQTWQRALYEYAKGNRPAAMYALGHILHLIADMTVPEHVRNDSHLGGPDTKSPLEDWAKGEILQEAIRSVLSKPAEIPRFNSLNEAFDQTAGYTNKNFFSVGTVGIDYNLPKPIRYKQEGRWIFAYSVDEFGQSYRLAAADLVKNDYRSNSNISSSNVSSPQFPQDFFIDNVYVIHDYWSLLSRKAVLNGAGVIDLFFREAEELKQLSDIDPRVLTAMNTTRANESAKGFVDRILGYVIALVAPGTSISPVVQTASPTPIVLAPSPAPSPRVAVAPSPSPSPRPLPPAESFFDVFVPLTPQPGQDNTSTGNAGGSVAQSSGNNGPLYAVTALSPSPSPTPLPSPSPSPSPEISPTPSPTPTPTPTPIPTPSPTPSPSPPPDSSPPPDPSPPPLLSYWWPFDSDLTDTVSGVTLWPSNATYEFVSGPIGNAVRIDAALGNGGIRAQDSFTPQVDLAKPWTIGGWLKRSSNDSFSAFQYRNGSAEVILSMNQVDTYVYFFWSYWNNSASCAVGVTGVDEWVHLAVRFDGAYLRCYRDGVRYGDEVGASPSFTSGTTRWFDFQGFYSPPSYPTYFDDVFFADYAMTDEEIYAMYRR